MKRMYEYVCESGHRTEFLAAYEATEMPCWCGGEAHRIISAPKFNLEGWSGHFPTAHGQFGRRHTEKLTAERKANS